MIFAPSEVTPTPVPLSVPITTALSVPEPIRSIGPALRPPSARPIGPVGSTIGRFSVTSFKVAVSVVPTPPVSLPITVAVAVISRISATATIAGEVAVTLLAVARTARTVRLTIPASRRPCAIPVEPTRTIASRCPVHRP